MPAQRGVLMALIPLPIYYNADRQGIRVPIEEEKFALTRDELARQFGGATLWVFHEERPTGAWWNLGILYLDELAAVEVDIPTTRVAKDQLRAYVRDTLIPRFRQEAIYVKLVPIATMLVMKKEIRP